MHYSVPQFIEVEDKIVGPLTMRQFLWLLGGAALIFILYFLLTLPALLIVGIPIAALAMGLAFLKLYRMPLGNFLWAFFRFSLTSQIFLWQRSKESSPGGEEKDRALFEERAVEAPLPQKPRPVAGRIRQLAWQLDIKGEEDASLVSAPRPPSSF